MSVFVDSSAIFAGIATNDSFHADAVGEWSRLIEREEQLVTHSLVEVEAAALLQRRVGMEALAAFNDVLLPRLHVVEIDRERRRAVLADVAARGSRQISFVDYVSFDLMKRSGLDRAFTFDRHFSEAGFELIGSDR